jgi:hypothetical protein
VSFSSLARLLVMSAEMVDEVQDQNSRVINEAGAKITVQVHHKR